MPAGVFTASLPPCKLIHISPSESVNFISEALGSAPDSPNLNTVFSPRLISVPFASVSLRLRPAWMKPSTLSASPRSSSSNATGSASGSTASSNTTVPDSTSCALPRFSTTFWSTASCVAMATTSGLVAGTGCAGISVAICSSASPAISVGISGTEGGRTANLHMVNPIAPTTIRPPAQYGHATRGAFTSSVRRCCKESVSGAPPTSCCSASANAAAVT